MPSSLTGLLNPAVKSGLGLLSLLPQGWIPDIVLDKRSKPIFPLELGLKV